MIPRSLRTRSRHVYPPEPWRLVQRRFSVRRVDEDETVFALGNGYLGIRGAYEEGAPVHQPGTFLNGFYESWPIIYGEEAHGFARTGQTIVNATNGMLVKLYVDDEPLYLPDANLLSFERALDMRTGTLDRELTWETEAGRRVRIRSRRLVSFAHRHLAALRYEVTVLDARTPLVLVSELRTDTRNQPDEADPRRAKGFRGRVLAPQEHEARGTRLRLAHATTQSDLRLTCAAEHLVDTSCPHALASESEDNRARVVLTVDAEPGEPVVLTKFLAYHTSERESVGELAGRADRLLDRAVAAGWDGLEAEQRASLAEFWRTADIEASGSVEWQQMLRFNLFHLLQASARVDGLGIPAKGVTGDGYEGHYFWDVEIYVLPFLAYTAPRIARNLLKVRYDQLDHARRRAAEVSQRGALFPWRTITGEEASAYYAAGTAQYHINADIAYALKKYVDVSGDDDFLLRYGAEILVETARLWVDLGFFSDRKGGAFCINGVTGPDEYNTVVDNNAYTNMMARANLRYAVRTLLWMREEHRDRYEALAERTELAEDEIATWSEAADAMYVPYNQSLGIHLQDDSFLDRKPWDFANTSAADLPLLLHYHPLVIYRHQVIKQADVVLAMFLLDHEFTPEQKRRNFDFYDPLTTGDSSLSASIQAIEAAELGYREKAREYAFYGGLMDLADIGGNVSHGVHIAAMGGTWMAVVYGLAGLRDGNGGFSFHPLRPQGALVYRIRLRIRGNLLEVSLAEEAGYALLEGDGVTLAHEGEAFTLTPDAPRASFPIRR